MVLNSIDVTRPLNWKAEEIFGIPHALWKAIKPPQPPDHSIKLYGTPWYEIDGITRLEKCFMGSKK